jgi:hypothetical protein
MNYRSEVAGFLADLDQGSMDLAQDDLQQADRYWAAAAADGEVGELLEAITELAPFHPVQDARLGALFQALTGRQWEAAVPEGHRLPAWLPDRLEKLYRSMGPTSQARAHLMQLLSMHGDRELEVVAECLVDEPPSDLQSVFLVFAPLFRRQDFDPENLFPRLLDGLAHPRLAASIVDLSNYVTETGLLEGHPAAARTVRLVGLLGELTQRLGQLEEHVGRRAGDAAQLAASVEDSVALAVALCRAFSLIGDRAAVGKLYQAADLRHRRLRVEAAAALISLGDDAGIDLLVRLASEPVVRQRVLAYANECDCQERVEAQYRTPEAVAEAELACWLAQPTQVGIPPTHLEVVDHRSLYWPGYENEVDCFLIRYMYQLEDGELSNIGLVGPVVHAFSADVADLSPDDIYSAFAGWHAVHEEIYELDFIELSEAQRVDISRFERRLSDAGYDTIRPMRLGSFFGEKSLIARAVRDGVGGIAVADPDRVDWWSTDNKHRPLDPDVVYCIAKGRKLLRSFNV